MEVLRLVYQIPFLSMPPLSEEPIPISSYSPSSIKGKVLEREILSLVKRGAVELAPLPSPGFYSRVFVVWKTSRSWRPVIDLSLLNLFILKTPFKMETLQSVLLSVHQGDWMVSGSQRCLLAGPYPSGQPQVSEVCGLRQGLPVQGSLFSSLHGPSGFHQGYGSGFDVSPPVRYLDPSVPRRLASSSCCSLLWRLFCVSAVIWELWSIPPSPIWLLCSGFCISVPSSTL